MNGLLISNSVRSTEATNSFLEFLGDWGEVFFGEGWGAGRGERGGTVALEWGVYLIVGRVRWVGGWWRLFFWGRRGGFEWVLCVRGRDIWCGWDSEVTLLILLFIDFSILELWDIFLVV